MAQQMTDRDSNNAWQWLVNGWHALRDKAVSAMTYFTPQREEEKAAQRWGVLATDVSEEKDSVHVELELPGMEKGDLSVEVLDEHLVVTGEKRTSAKREEGSLVITERAYGSFKRVIPLPCSVESAGTKATYKDGVLSVTMPKDRKQQPRSIKIERG